jgi:beta-lactamase regulating signal transducer with metallopeptidase domain
MNFDSNLFVRLGLAAAPALLIKVTFLLATGAAAAQLLHRRSAAARHFVWLLTLIGVLGITALATFPRGMSVAVPHWPQWASASGSAPHAGSPRSGAVDALALRPTVVGDGGGAARVSNERDPAARPPDFARLGALLAKLWLAGTCLVLAWLALGHVGLARISVRSDPVGDPAWGALLLRLAREIGASRKVRLRLSRDVGAPLVCGLFRPSILLPADAGSWNSERRRVVLLHELAHVQRRDPLAQSIAWLACSAYWFHPAVWSAAARLRAESERACDDRVLSSGVAGADYASHLLSLARRARALRLAGSVSVAMARRSTLEGRLLSLLDESVRRGVLSARVRGAGIAMLAMILLALGLVRPVPPAASEAPVSDPAGSAQAKARAVSDAEAGAAAAGAADEARAVSDAEAGAPSFDRSLPAVPGETLVLDLETGAVVMIRGWDERRVEARGWLRGPDAQHQSAGLVREGSRVVLRVKPEKRTGSFSTSNRFTLRVPRRFDVRISSAGGKVTILDVEGSLEGSSGGGGLVIERSRGRARLSTNGGDIRVMDCDLSGTVSTEKGTVWLSRVRGGLRGTSGSGPVIYSEAPGGHGASVTGDPGDLGDLGDLEVDGSTITIGGGTARDGSKGQRSGTWPAGMLHVEKAGGEIRMEEAPNGVSASTGGGAITIGRAGEMVDASTGGGDIEIGPASGSVRAGTGAGDVHVILAKGHPRRTVDVTSGHGGVVIELPRGLEVDLDLETAYTRSSHPTSIRSDVPVRIEPATDWDNREGTPRRYVRARSARGGAALVRIKTVNGNIEIRTTGSL